MWCTQNDYDYSHRLCDTLSVVYSVTVSNKTSKELWI